MRKVWLAALISLAFAGPVNATSSAGGSLSMVDQSNKTFSCHWKNGEQTYKTTDKTTFRLGKKRGSFSDLKVGQTIKLIYHFVGKNRIANKVMIKAP